MINLNNTKRDLLLEAGRLLFYGTIGFGSCFSAKVSCEYRDNAHSYEKDETKSVERLIIDGQEYGVLVKRGEKPYLAFTINKKGKLEARYLSDFENPFEVTETKIYDSNGKLKGLEKKLNIIGVEVPISAVLHH